MNRHTQTHWHTDRQIRTKILGTKNIFWIFGVERFKPCFKKTRVQLDPSFQSHCWNINCMCSCDWCFTSLSTIVQSYHIGGCLLHEHSCFKCCQHWCTVPQTQHKSAPPCNILTPGQPVLFPPLCMFRSSEKTTRTNLNTFRPATSRLQGELCIQAADQPIQWSGVRSLHSTIMKVFKLVMARSLPGWFCS